MSGKTTQQESKAERIAREASERLATIAAALEPVATRVVAAAKAWVKLQKQNTDVRVQMGNAVQLMDSALLSAQYPEADRPQAILDHLATLGVTGFTYPTVKSWGLASDAHKRLAGVKVDNPLDSDGDQVELRDHLPLYTLIGLGRISSAEDDPTGGIAKVAVAAWDNPDSKAGKARTDDNMREFVREAIRTAKGIEPKKPPTASEMATAIAKANEDGYPVPVLTPETDDNGIPVDEYRVTLDDLISVAVFGYAWRDKAGTKSQEAYRRAFMDALSPVVEAAPEADGSGAEDANAATVEA